MEAYSRFKGKDAGAHYTSNDLAMEVAMGDKFENIHSSTLINRSLMENSFNKVKSDLDEETADAIRKVADAIERSNNQEAAENFDSFNEELQKPEPKKAVLRTLWFGMTTALPRKVKISERIDLTEVTSPSPPAIGLSSAPLSPIIKADSR